MQKLHLVGFTTEHDGLVFSARKGSKAGGYIVPLDGELLSTIAEAERLRNGKKAEQADEQGTRPRRADSRLTPREIQAHLRTGRSIPEVAAEAGVDVEWVERFAVPIVAEQAQMVERARAMTYSKARLGQSTQPLGISVRWNLAEKGVAISEEAFDEGWTAFQLQDEVWMIRFRYTSRARLQVAEWELDLGRNQVTSRNRLASELGYVEKGRRPPAIPSPTPRVVAAPPVRVVEEVVEEIAPEPEPEPEEAPAPAPRRRSPARARSRRAPARKKTPVRKKTPLRKKTAVRKKSPAKKRAPAPKKAPARGKKSPAVKRPAAKKKATTARKAPSKTAAVKRPTNRRNQSWAKAVAAPRPAKKPARPTPPPAPAVAEAPAPAPARPKRAPAPRRASQARRPRIAAASAKDAAAKRSAPSAARKQPAKRSSTRPTRKRTQSARTQRPLRKTSTGNAATPNLSGPLARSLLARRLMARKAAQGNGGKQAQRPLRVR